VPAHTGHPRIPAAPPAVGPPLLHRRRVLRALRAARTAAGLTQEQLAQDLGWSLSKVIRIENGTVGATRSDVIAILWTCEIDDRVLIDDLAASAKPGRRPDPCWSRFTDKVDAGTIDFYAHEQIAVRIRHVQLALVPDLLLHPAYALEACPSFCDATEQQSTDGLAILAQRQTLLAPGGPEVTVILDQGVIDHAVLGPVSDEAFTAQFEHLLAVIDSGKATLQVLPLQGPLRAGAAPSTYTLFDLPEEEEPLVFLPLPGCTFRAHDLPQRWPAFVENFDRLLPHCLDQDASRDLLVDAMIRRAERRRIYAGGRLR